MTAMRMTLVVIPRTPSVVRRKADILMSSEQTKGEARVLLLDGATTSPARPGMAALEPTPFRHDT